MKSKLAWIPFVPLFLIACFLKLSQGLFDEGAVLGLSNLTLEYTFIAAVTLIFAFSMLFVFADKKMAQYYLLNRNIPAGVLSLVIALVLAADGANSVFRILSAGKIDIIGMAEAVLQLLSAVVFIVLAMNHFVESQEGGKRFTMFYVLPALLCAVRMIVCFVGFTTVSLRTADISSLICYVFATLFFFHYAIVLSATENKKSLKATFYFGFPAAASLVVYGLANLLFKYDSNGILQNLDSIQALLLGLYIIAVLIEFTVLVQKADDVKIVIDDPNAEKPVIEEKIDDFVVRIVPEEEKIGNASYFAHTDTQDYLYQEIKKDKKLEEAPVEFDEEVKREAARDYITDVKKNENDGDGSNSYEDSLDEIDKLIIEINGQSD